MVYSDRLLLLLKDSEDIEGLVTHANHTAGSGRGRCAAIRPPNVVESSDSCRYESAASDMAGMRRSMLQYGLSLATVFPTWRLSVRAYVSGFIHTMFSLGHHLPGSGQRLCVRHGSGMCYCLFWDGPEWALSTLNHDCRSCICGKLKIFSKTHSI